jgi:hypothetical protein
MVDLEHLVRVMAEIKLEQMKDSLEETALVQAAAEAKQEAQEAVKVEMV